MKILISTLLSLSLFMVYSQNQELIIIHNGKIISEPNINCFIKLDGDSTLSINTKNIKLPKHEKYLILSINIILKKDTLSFFNSEYTVNTAQNKYQKKHLLFKAKEIVEYNENWILYIDTEPFERNVEGHNHHKIALKKDPMPDVIFHLRIKNSSFVYK